MYFVEPTQLPAVFSRLEETNLFLMQNGQEAEAALEETMARQRATRIAMERDADALRAQIETLRGLIRDEEEEAEELRGRDVEDEKKARRRARMEKQTTRGQGIKPAGGYEEAITMLREEIAKDPSKWDSPTSVRASRWSTSGGSPRRTLSAARPSCTTTRSPSKPSTCATTTTGAQWRQWTCSSLVWAS